MLYSEQGKDQQFGQVKKWAQRIGAADIPPRAEAGEAAAVQVHHREPHRAAVRGAEGEAAPRQAARRQAGAGRTLTVPRRRTAATADAEESSLRMTGLSPLSA